MFEETVDPYTVIVNRTSDYVEYENTGGGRWRISGTCIACGLCETKPEVIPSIILEKNYVPNSNEVWERTVSWSAEPGTPGACIESGFNSRKDIPMTPDFVNNTPGCALRGEWLNAN